MARRTYRRDSRGRFAGSGAMSSSTRGTESGARARRSARTMRQEQAGAKERASYNAGNARRSLKHRASALADGGNKAGANLIGQSASLYGRKANQARKKGKTMERERRSLVRRGAMRGGG